eukprot:CAMPEP_0114586834 /NCGR_PEP_ID=MMETSP0125-20121206/9956_1 /TAXON_ID=485358 ORGANISM="Aristerostoma sp., Strain ATCC 50986" /NCGR_SAMPLE_ID=MMETSP0125 /ASSEMBLY_ACC=CAM_ASM_000245 /LENGTH=55 /DNA_ID=CAMNT_0001782465 /DNA_START=480 /DNA_END=647 /DNA_ORIENTATION=-
MNVVKTSPWVVQIMDNSVRMEYPLIAGQTVMTTGKAIALHIAAYSSTDADNSLLV